MDIIMNITGYPFMICKDIFFHTRYSLVYPFISFMSSLAGSRQWAAGRPADGADPRPNPGPGAGRVRRAGPTTGRDSITPYIRQV